MNGQMSAAFRLQKYPTLYDSLLVGTGKVLAIAAA
jgi:hypothetical protein